MSSLFIETQDIIKITGQRFYRRGLDYYKKGRVHQLSFNRAIQCWSATVKGASSYQVRIFLFKDDDLEATCNCPAYEAHYTCKHIAAVLLAISHSQQPNQVYQEPVIQQSTDPFPLRMIQAFEANAPGVSQDRQLLKIMFILTEVKQGANMETYYKLSIKAGDSQLFIVKDIEQFIEALLNQQVYKITNTFSYRPNLFSLMPNDLLICELVEQAIHHAHVYRTDFLELDNRELVIPPFLLKELLAHLVGSMLTFIKSEDNSSFAEIHSYQSLPQLAIQVELSNQHAYSVNLSQLFKHHFSHAYQLLVYNNHFYFLSSEKVKILKQLYALLPYRQKQTYLINRSQMPDFVGHVVPKLKQIGSVQLSSETERTLKQAPLLPKLFVDEEKGSLTVSCSFQYDQIEISPFQKQVNHEQVLLRDFAGEAAIIQKLENSGFHYLNQRFQLFNEAQIHHFINNVIPELTNQASIYLSDKVKLLLTKSKPQLHSNIDLNHQTGLLDVQFDIEGITKDDIDALLEALIEKKSYFRASNGPLIDLNDQTFAEFKALADQLRIKKKDIQHGEAHIHAARGLQITQALSNNNTHYSKTFKQLLTTLKHGRKDDYPLPVGLTAELRDYQLIGFKWFKALASYHLGGILADEMGLGKTVQAISFIASEKETAAQQKSLIITPASLLYNWKKEFQKFAPELIVKVITGTKTERRERIKSNKKVDVLITSYPLLRQDYPVLEDQQFDIVILDEAQAIKNHLTQTAKATRQIRATHRFALSGTPIENRQEELWSIFQTISPGFLGSKKQFVNYSNEQIKQITQPFILRRLKIDVLPDLPEKIEFEQYSDLTIEQKQVYLVYLQKMQQKLDEAIRSNQFETGKLDILAGLTRLRQICCHPKLFLDNYQGESGKLSLLLTILEQLQAQGRRVLIFSQFSSMLKLILAELNKLNYLSFYLDGQTPALERVEMAEAFNNGDCNVFLVSLKAGGTGLNLTGADTVILFDLWWNPAVEAQAAGRAHRIGQKNKVEVIRLITEGTIEEKIFQLQQGKRELVDQIIAPSNTLLSSLTEAQLRELLTFEQNE
ncbi:Superfamily II DNA or RNA helicase, SNF2 family [Amphibacillus marinus]|uniref:Superfamily II DNA or RNA helicase, SNF2 family n=1 Tax=Amphibacillus marinus TaxID=872970 RepID=A0A1H8RRW6_9BACI|nr:DEAD/DEAH box helicase [Amphibacillus marinus]SEO68693.1 Superfamily II DNA or RNA helicase, SNF2 family [Amphibacillus marinus]